MLRPFALLCVVGSRGGLSFCATIETSPQTQFSYVQTDATTPNNGQRPFSRRF